MNVNEAKSLGVGEKFRGENGDVYVVMPSLNDKAWERFIPAVTEADSAKGVTECTHLFLPDEMEAF